MFLRRYRNSKDSKTHTYFTLVESSRTDAGPRQRFIACVGELNHDQERRWHRTVFSTTATSPLRHTAAASLRRRVTPPPRLSAAASHRRRVPPPPRPTAVTSRRRHVTPPSRHAAAPSRRRASRRNDCGPFDFMCRSTASVSAMTAGTGLASAKAIDKVLTCPHFLY
jgi:hypothetical protein